ncbi:MAG: 2-amino-4-hydroxy-6-hydroxymethyldihydropteridine diphosphokinase [Gammaproteobacteria bacterium]|nr:2-amino-4-hydroxy-6-hydroxymethyldihydropteridine diphosphokinase [Gammaproteobacteria bacterium]
MIKAYLGLGANLGDPVQQILDARRSLFALPGVTQARSSSLYLSSAVGPGSSGEYVNCVVELGGQLSLADLFDAMQGIEVELGRVRSADNRNESRYIDIDLLVFDQLQQDDPVLTLPHPRLHERLFVLLPLLEIAPQISIQPLGQISDILQRGRDGQVFAGQDIVKLGA